MSERKQWVSSFSWNSLTVVLQVVIQLLYTAVMARWIAPSDFAMMGVVLSMMGFAEIFSQVGIGPAIIQRKHIEQQHINGAFWTAVALGLSFTLLFVGMAPWLSHIYHMPRLTLITQVVSTSFFISALGVVPRSFMMKQMAFKTFFKASMISIVGGNLLVGLTLAFLGWGVWAYVWALFAQNALMTLAYWWYTPIKVGMAGLKQGTKDLLHYGVGSTLFNALNYAATKVDVTLVPLGLGQQQWLMAGWYERSAYVVSLPITIMAKLSDNVLFSGMSKMQEERERLKRLVVLTTHVLGLAIIPASIWVIFHAEWLMTFYLGNQYAGSGVILQYLFVAVIFRTLNRVSDALLRAVNATFQASWIKLIYVAMMALGTWYALPYGVQFVGLAIALSTAVHFLMGAWMGQKMIGGSFGEVLVITRYAWGIGVIVALEQWGIVCCFSSQPLIAAVIGLVALMLTLMLIIMKKKEWLGTSDVNPIQFLPERIRTKFKLN
jgi:PST family polysaccharide transporter